LKVNTLVRKFGPTEYHPVEAGIVKNARTNAAGRSAPIIVPQSSCVMVMAVSLQILVALSPK
jgi:hypothetical protein